MTTKATLLVLVLLSLLMAVFAQQPIILELGTPVHGTIESAQWDYYKLPRLSTPLSPNTELIIALTGLSGDPDLYIGVNFVPTLFNYTYFKNQNGFDVITINTGSPYYSPENEYYINVYGYTKGVYTITAFVTNGHQILLDGVPQFSQCEPQSFQYYSFNLADNDDFTISITPITGDPDLYVSTERQFPGKNAGEYTWQSATYGYDLLDILHTDPNFKASTTYYIAVYCFGSTTGQFSIRASRFSNIGQIAEGVPIAEDVEKDKYTYFSFFLCFNRSLTISVTALNSNGDPDLYISTTEHKPTDTKYTWASRFLGDDVITISNKDPNFKAPAWYYIGVKGFAETIFSLLAKSEGESELIPDGVTIHDTVGITHPNFYRFYHGDEQSNRLVSITVSAGILNMYMSKTETQPSADKSEWVSTNIGMSGYIYLPSPVQVGWYYVGIYAASHTGATYSISVSSNQTFTILHAGELSFFNQVPANYYRYFVFDMGAGGQDITISLKPFSGDADMYVSIAPTIPTKNNYTWKSNNVGADTVAILESDEHYCSNCRYIIGAYGFTEAYFEIIVQLSKGINSLREGIPTTGFVDANGWTYYKFTLQNEGALTFTLQINSPPETGADPDMYVSMKPLPTKLDYQWKSVTFGDEFIDISNAQSGDYYIGVFGNFVNCSYTLTGTTKFQYLYEGQAVLDSVIIQQYRVYQVNVDPSAEYVLASLTLIDGATELYISVDSSVIPDRWHHDYASTTWPGNSILVKNTDSHWKTGQWYIAVYGFQSSQYNVIFQTNLKKANLYDGLPLLGTAAPTFPIGYKYYVPSPVSTGKPIEDHWLNIRIFNGDVTMFASQVDPDPSLFNYTWTSSGAQNQRIYLSPNKLQGGYLYINIYSSNKDSDSQYMITMETPSSPLFLTQEQPQIVTTENGKYSNFQILSAVEPVAMMVETQSCDLNDAPKIFASNFSSPNASNFKYQSFPLYSYYQLLTVPIGPQSVFYLSTYGNGGTYAIYCTTSDDDRPFPSHSNMTGVYNQNNQTFTLYIPFAYGLYFPMSYLVFANIIDDPENWYRTINLNTPCGTVTYGKYVGKVESNDMNNQTFNFQMDASKIYAIQVIVQDGLGLRGIYTPLIIDHGSPYQPGGSFDFPISFGLILIVLAIIVITLYFAIGTTVKVIQGARGFEAIPNIDLWRGLPSLVWDGVRFMFTCGKGLPSAYSNLVETSVNTSGFDNTPASGSTVESQLPQLQPQEKQPAEQEPAQTTSTEKASYGTI